MDHHVCGLFYMSANVGKYLPQVHLEAHASIIGYTSRTTLTQTFVNPNAKSALEEVWYRFPLFDGVSVVAFTCTVGDRIIKGVVKERQQAREEYDEAVSQGKTAGLLEVLLSASDVFTTSIGNIPAGAVVKVDITYLGELKHDAQVDGVRLTIPTAIAPRYGEYADKIPSGSTVSGQGIKITVDAEVAKGSNITSIQSPSHNIAVTLGRTSITAQDAEPSFQRASATLALGKVELEKDFILQVVASNIGNPLALLEQHPTIPNQRAIMATLVPKFTLPAEKPEIVFVCDRSGSMDDKVENLKAALRLFVKSLTVGTKFNICSFGSHFTFLWDRSRTYDSSSVDAAMKHIETFQADYGGTEMYQPMEATFKQRYTDMNLEVFLLTDGQIWDQQNLFNLVNAKVAESKGAVRVFSLGIGDGASHSLIEGLARAGNGFAQSVSDNEDMSSKVVRMLKGAMFPHVTDYSLEVKYEKSEDEDFEFVEKVMDSLTVKSIEEPPKYEETDTKTEKKPLSLFDSSVTDNTEKKPAKDAKVDRFSHVPKVSPPKLLQAPFEIPPLFPFNRTSVYLLISSESSQKMPTSVVLRGTSKHGPLELEIPITVLEGKSETIHQLAAKKAMGELEEGRGWLYHAKTADRKLLKDAHDGHFSDMVEREAVRLGVQFQVAGKWCSFIAMEGENEVKSPTALPDATQLLEYEGGGASMSFRTGRKKSKMMVPGGGFFPTALARSRPGGMAYSVDKSSSVPISAPVSASRSGGIGSKIASSVTSMFGRRQSATLSFGASSYAPAPPAPPPSFAYAAPMAQPAPAPDMAAAFPAARMMAPSSSAEFDMPKMEAVSEKKRRSNLPADKVQALVTLQSFEGSWVWNDEIAGVTQKKVAELSQNLGAETKFDKVLKLQNWADVAITAWVVGWLRKEKAAEKDVWELLVDKAMAWLDMQLASTGVSSEDLVSKMA